MKVKDLKVGMVLEIDDGGARNLVMVCNRVAGLCVSGPHTRFPLQEFDDNLCYEDVSVMKVYDIAEYCMSAYKLSTEGRKLLWEREGQETADEATDKATDKTITITIDDYIAASAKAFTDMTVKNPKILFFAGVLGEASARTANILFKEEK